MALDVKKYVKGECFICGESCSEGKFAHYECCVAYSDDKDKRIQEAVKNNEYH